MQVSVRLFAGLRERAGTDRLELELPDDARVADVLAAMAGTPVGALRPRECVVAVNREYATGRRAGAGGRRGRARAAGERGRSASCATCASPASRSIWRRLADAVRDPRAGAVVLFEGVTREVPELDYEAYAEMATARIEAIAAEEAERHGLCAVAIEHRTGTVPLSRAVGDRRRLGAAPWRGVRRRPRTDRPREGRGADLEGSPPP